MFKMKKTFGLIALAALLTAGAATAAESSCCPAELPAPAEGLSISKGFQTLWQSTGIYRFLNPETQDEKQAAYLDATIKTVEAEISAGHFANVHTVLEKAATHGVAPEVIAELKGNLVAAEAEGYTSHGLLPEGAGQFVMILIGLLLIWLAIAKGFEPLLLLPI